MSIGTATRNRVRFETVQLLFGRHHRRTQNRRKAEIQPDNAACQSDNLFGRQNRFLRIRCRRENNQGHGQR